MPVAYDVHGLQLHNQNCFCYWILVVWYSMRTVCGVLEASYIIAGSQIFKYLV